MSRHPLARIAAPLAALGLLLAGCAQEGPGPLVRRTVEPATQIDPAAPCVRADAGAGSAATDPAAPAGLAARLDRATNTIVLTGGQGVTLPALGAQIGDENALREVAPGEWLLGANLQVDRGASLQIAAPGVRWLKLASGAGGFVTVKALGGGLDVTGSCVTSWDTAQNAVDTNNEDGRAYLLARDGGQMAIDRAELRFLGFGEVESYGLSWRTEGTGGKLTNSIVSHNYFGIYTFEVGGLPVTDNEIHDNVLYGVDPHTGSHDLQIERNTVHHNGKHGIILAEDCTDSVIRENIVYANQHHGIVLYLHSDRNTIERNETFANASQGINVNESSGNTVRSNRVYDNTESGIGIAQSSHDNIVEQNEIRANQQDGVRLVSESATTTVRDNVIGENARYGVYVDSDGAFTLTGNTIFGSRMGVLIKGTSELPEGDNNVFDNRETDIKAG
jgi:parallel beta-helix repeat protein